MDCCSQVGSGRASFRGTTLLFLLLTDFFLLGCDNAIQPIQTSWTVSGSTHYVGSPAPVGGVLVKCAGATATSAADGFYQLSGIPQGAQVITAERSDCSSYADTVIVKSDTKYYIFLKLLSTRLTGSVSNVIDGPVRGATVEMHGVATSTDNSGRYELLEVPRGSDTLYVAHPNYIAYKSAVSLTASEQQNNVILSRERVVQGTVTEDAFVEESFPNNNFSGSNLLVLSTTGTGLPANNHRHIYIKFSFPSFFSDSRVSILSASLELLMYSSAVPSGYQTYAVDSAWTRGTITYNTQPTRGSPLSAGAFGDGSSGKYWSFLGTNGANTVLADWRANKPIYGIVIQGGSQVSLVTFFYALESLAGPPKITFTVRY